MRTTANIKAKSWGLGLFLAALLAVGFRISRQSVALAGASSTTWKGGPGNWSDSSKWTNGVPNGSTDALIDGGNPVASPVTLDTFGEANNLTIDKDDSLSFNNGTSLTIEGSSISNAGSISLNSTGSGTSLGFHSSATLAGAGTLTMSNNPNNSISGAFGATFTNQSTIQGAAGNIGGDTFVLANQGKINANTGGATLTVQASDGSTNTGTLEATGGATLHLEFGSFTNTGGTIQAVGSGSQVLLDGVTVSGGTLATSSGGVIGPGTFIPTLSGLTNADTYEAFDSSQTYLAGTITNSGTIQLNSTGSATQLFVPSAATLAGAGKVAMSNSAHNFFNGGSGASLTNQNTIQGGAGNIGTGASPWRAIEA